MSSFTGHLMKRGHDAYLNMSGDEDLKIVVSPLAMLMLGTTALLYVGFTFMIEYTYGRVIPTLLMIESPAENITFEAIPTTDADDGMPKDPETTTTKAKFITSSFRKSIQLLHSKGGFRGRFRGLSMFIAHNVAVQWITRTVSFLPNMGILPIALANMVASVLCAQLSLGWTLIVISEPSPKPWFRRIPNLKMWKKIAGPTAIYALTEQLAVAVPLYVAVNLGLFENPKDFANLPDRQQGIAIAKFSGIFALGLLISLFIVVPSNIILTRIQASLINEAEETIVPFDRSFGGKVVPEIIGGSGRIGIIDAWKTFDWPARLRLVKAYAKVIAMVAGISILFIAVFVVQLHAIGGMEKVIVPADGKN